MSDLGLYEERKRIIRKDSALFLALSVLSGLAVLVEYRLGITGIKLILTILAFMAFTATAVGYLLMKDRIIKNWSKYMADERTQKIDTNARAASWILTFCIAGLLAGLAMLHIVDMGTDASLILVFLTMLYSWFFFRWYYDRRGDAE